MKEEKGKTFRKIFLEVRKSSDDSMLQKLIFWRKEMERSKYETDVMGMKYYNANLKFKIVLNETEVGGGRSSRIVSQVKLVAFYSIAPSLPSSQGIFY